MKSWRLMPTCQRNGLVEQLSRCRACERLRPFQNSDAVRTRTRHFKRHQSSWASTAVVSGTASAPAKFEPLHRSLDEVRKNASAHINLSRLQLAIKSLETSNPTIRLAILGLGVPDTARRVVRLLLADALEDEGHWEEQLVNGTQDFSRGLIIRYGNEDNTTHTLRPKTSIPILLVPSAVLRKNNLEILVSSINKPNGNLAPETQVQTSSDIFLSPTVGTPTSESGRQVSIAQPAHRCLLVVNGLDELVVAAELLATTKFWTREDRDAVMAVTNLEAVILADPDRKTLVVDTGRAEEGLAAIRKSVTHAIEYEHKWIDAGMPALSRWLALAGTQHGVDAEQLAEPVRNLISSLLTAATSSIQGVALEASQVAQRRRMSSATKAQLEEAIDRFSRSAHQELQSGLASAWQSRNWRKLAWYKLFWRVDDVGLLITDLVTNAWLPMTERAVYELSGRLAQVGIDPVTDPVIPSLAQVSEASETSSISSTTVLQPDAQLSAAAIAIPSVGPVLATDSEKLDVRMQPLPQTASPAIASSISRARSAYMSDAITSLTTAAQQLVFRTLSIVGLSAGLSSLTYVSVFSSVYEAGTIAAIGAVFALWTMQSGWQKSTRQLERGLFDEGRRAIIDIVDRMKVLVEQKSQIQDDPAELEPITRAEDAVTQAQAELEKLGKLDKQSITRTRT